MQFPLVNQQSDLDANIAHLEASGLFDVVVQTWIETQRKIPDLGMDPKWDTWQLDKNNPQGNNWGYEFIDLPKAWDITTGIYGNNPKVKVGVVSIDFDPNHKDLNPNTNDYAYKPNSSPADTNHGTAVAGIIGAKGNNNLGISGVMWDVDLKLWVFA